MLQQRTRSNLFASGPRYSYPRGPAAVWRSLERPTSAQPGIHVFKSLVEREALVKQCFHSQYNYTCTSTYAHICGCGWPSQALAILFGVVLLRRAGTDATSFAKKDSGEIPGHNSRPHECHITLASTCLSCLSKRASGFQIPLSNVDLYGTNPAVLRTLVPSPLSYQIHWVSHLMDWAVMAE